MIRSTISACLMLCAMAAQQLTLPAAASAGEDQRAAVMLAPPVAGETIPLPGSHLLGAKERFLRTYLEAHPELQSPAPSEQLTAWSFNVGSAASWYADDFTVISPDPNASRYLVPATCRAVGEHCYVFVEDQTWLSGRVTQASVDSVVRVFDENTPADPVSGVFELCQVTFGDPPDVDGDPRIIILMLDILDGYAGSGGYVAGYFYSLDQFPKSAFPTSNVAEIYYLDCNPADLGSTSGLKSAMGVTAHEFQHMIHFRYDPQESIFFNEMCSVTAEVVCGYPVYNQTYYVQETDHYLLDWRGSDNVAVLGDYSRAARFGLYVLEQYGASVFRQIVASPLRSIAGFEAGILAAGFGTGSFQGTFTEWLIANVLNDRAVDPRWGYVYPGLPAAEGISYGTPAVEPTEASVDRLAADYISFVGGNGLTVTFSEVSPSLMIRAVETGPGLSRVLPVTPGVPFAEPEFGTTLTAVHFVVTNTSQTTPGTYTYAASGNPGGAIELKWDDTAARGYLAGMEGDTACVVFEGYPGARVDSIRVSLSRPGTMSGGVWQYTGASRPTPLGTALAVPFTATAVVPGWTAVDLRSATVDASQPFAVALVNQGDHQLQPRVQVTTHPGATPYNSYTYLNSASPADWYYLTQSADSVWIYLIRAYISYPTAVGEGDAPTVPFAARLEQNYPNPLNPATTIRYRLPSNGYVRLEVFSMVGERVAVLVEGEMPKGDHVAEWVPRREASGMYLLRLQADGQMMTRRMVLVR